MHKAYIQHEGKVIEASGKFEHVMAITLDPRTNYTEGVARCITYRIGNASIVGYVDRSKLYKIKGDFLEKFELTEELEIKNSEKIIDSLVEKEDDFLGLEDPDIFIDEENDLMHLYFTMPVKKESEKGYRIHLGHAVGKNLDSLEMTLPALISPGLSGGAKEVSIAPPNSKGLRYNLVESSKRGENSKYDTARVVIAKNMGEPWKFGEIAFDPETTDISWLKGVSSPGPLLPKTFINIGENKLLGILNGNEGKKIVNGKILRGIFSIGLFIYDYEHGKIDWVSPEPFIIDTEAVSITFASQFVETKSGEGILYAHVDDSFVRAYSLYAEGIKELLPKEYLT